ncbi:MAG: MarR family winged helix-turn-helix transcriptional regulator [Sphingomicrobium sp.]
MDAVATDAQNLTYSDLPPVLLAASSAAGFARARPAIDAAGMRVAATVLVTEAEARMDRQAAASALWLEIDQDHGTALDALLLRVNREVGEGRYPAIVATSAALVDPVLARLDRTEVDMLVDASEAERVAALAVALHHPFREQRVADVSSDQSAARLRQLSEEVGRIASTLARLSSAPPSSPTLPTAALSPTNEPLPVSVDQVRSVIRARRLRSRFFAEELFADPAWDMLLDLLQAEISQLRVPVSSLCIAAAVPATTALRWLRTMVDQKLFVRRADPHDGRRVFVELAPETSRAMRGYFAEVGSVAAA